MEVCTMIKTTKSLTDCLQANAGLYFAIDPEMCRAEANAARAGNALLSRQNAR